MLVELEFQDHVAIITLNRPEARNAVNGPIAVGLEEAMDKFEKRTVIMGGYFKV